MRALFVAVCLILVGPATASPGGLPRGEWHSTDLRGLEIPPGGACVRLWLEERTYNIVPAGPSRFIGVYGNVLQAFPVGIPSFRKECQYPAPRGNPAASQVRFWSIVGDEAGDQAWRVRAQPGLFGGDFHTDKSDEFETKLFLRGDRLVDSADGSEDPGKALIFRAPAPLPAAARAALEDTIRRLHGGACLEVMTKLGPSRDAARQSCALRQRAAEIAGRLLSISMDGATEIDRVPAGFPRAPAEGYRRQRAVFFNFLGRYETQQVPGSALVIEEEGTWNVAQLWF